MKYIYAAMILHNTDREITEQNVRDILEAADAEVNEHRITALVESLNDVGIEEAIENNQLQVPKQTTETHEETEEESEEQNEDEHEEEKTEEDEDDDDGMDGDGGLGELFG